MLILYGMVTSAMTINLYVNTADNNKVDKTANLTLIRSASGTPVEPFSLLSPVFTIEHTEGDMSCNYVKAQGRSYFAKVDKLNGGRLRITCAVDALDSWKQGVKNSEATVIRGGSAPTDIPDNKLPMSDTTFIESAFLNIDVPENAYLYAVTVFGGE